MQTCNSTTLSGLKNSYAIHRALMKYYPTFGELLEIYGKDLKGVNCSTVDAKTAESLMEEHSLLPPFFRHFIVNTNKTNEDIYDQEIGLLYNLYGAYPIGCCNDCKKYRSSPITEWYKYLMVLDINMKLILIDKKRIIHTKKYVNMDKEKLDILNISASKKASFSNTILNHVSREVRIFSEIDVIAESID